VTLNATDPDGPGATLTYQAWVFRTALDAQAYAVVQALRLSELGGSFYQSTFGANVVWLKSTNGHNAAGMGWYNLFSDGTLRAWNGSSDPNVIATEPVIATFSPAYYSNPNQLLNPTAAAGVSVLFGGTNVGTFSGFSAAGTFFVGAVVTDGISTANAWTTFQVNVS
jgi:hypothetical protein